MIAWALVAAWAAFIFYMSAHTDSDLNEGDDLVAHVKRWLNAIQLQLFGEGVDAVSSLAHFCEYTVFGALLANAVGKRASAKQLMVFGVAVGIASAYAVTDEVHQLFVPDRMCDIVD